MTDKYKGKYRIASARLQTWDYSSEAAYFITICTKNRENYFGEIQNDVMLFTPIGKFTDEEWQKMPEVYDNLILDNFVVMPNHVHLLFYINYKTPNFQKEFTPNSFGPLIKKSVSSIINHYKGRITKYGNNNNIIFGWQSRFHDRIIWNADSMFKARQYIEDNPKNWEKDKNNPEGLYM